MVCKICGNDVKDDWKNCPICGNALFDNGSGNIEEKNMISGSERPERVPDTGSHEPVRMKKRKLPLIFGGALAVVIACVCIFLFGEDKEIYSKALELVQNGTYMGYTDVLLKDVLEYNWKDGIWDSFEAENNNGDTLLIVEYAKDKSRDTMIQFSVKPEKESFRMVHLKIDGKALLNEEADEKIRKMYLEYFAEKYPLDGIDLSEYAGGEYADLAKASNAFVITDEEMLLCEDVSRQVMIDLTDDKLIQQIVIEGDDTYTPGFAGNKTGIKFADIDKRALEEKGYTKVFLEDESYYVYGNPDNKSVVGFKAEENEVISEIVWNADMYDDYLEEAEEDEVGGTVQFAGKAGTYISENLGDYTGRIEVISADAGSIAFTLGTLEYSPNVMSGEARIIDSNTAQMSDYGFTITFRWTDSGTMSVTHSGEITGMDSAIIFDVTNNLDYTWAAEFNFNGGTE